MEARNFNFDEMYEQETIVPFPEVIFTVDSDSKAEWLLEKLKAKQEKAEHFISHYKKQIEKIQAELDNYTSWANYKLMQYMGSGLIPLKETKTERKYSLPSADIKIKQQPLKYERDETALLQELKEKGMQGYIVSKHSVSWADLKKQVIALENGDVIYKETGELLENVKAVPQEDKFSISFKE